jgi:hypothetical protein
MPVENGEEGKDNLFFSLRSCEKNLILSDFMSNRGVLCTKKPLMPISLPSL